MKKKFKEVKSENTVAGIQLIEAIKGIDIEAMLDRTGHSSIETFIEDRVNRYYEYKKQLLLDGKQEFEIRELCEKGLFEGIELN